MLRRIYTTIMAVIAAIAMLLPTAAAYGQSAQIPAGYVLVPMSSFTGMAAPAAAPVAQTQPDASVSSVRAKKDFGFTQDAIAVTVTLRDSSNAPIAGHAITLLSSRSTDVVTAKNGTTDGNGEASFTVSGKGEGVATMTALDATTGVTLIERPKIIFLQKKAVGGDLLKSDVLADTSGSTKTAASTGIAYEKKLSVSFPDKVIAGRPYDITVAALDKDGVRDGTFAGSVLFSSSDAKALLPSPKTYTELEQGEHTFARAVTLSEAGQVTITVSAGDTVAPQTVTTEVIAETEAGDAPLITLPKEGDITKGPAILQGSTLPNVNVAILVDDQKFMDGQSDSDGNFKITLTGLDDGEHVIAVARLAADETIGATSMPINVTIDSIMPKMKSFAITPTSIVQVGTTVDVTVVSEPSLTNVRLEIGKDPLKLIETAPGTYSGQIRTKVAKDYLIDVVLTDSAGNQTRERDAGALRVVNELPKEEDKTVKPAPKVAELNLLNVAANGKNSRVDISWAAPINAAEVSYYVVTYGTQAGHPEYIYQTPDNRTGWFISNLQNDTTYYFTVESYTAAREKVGYSAEVSATPTTVLGLLAESCSTAVTLSWKPKGAENIAQYEVDYGIASGKFTERVVVPVTQTSATVRNLVDGQPYYFTVRGLSVRGDIVWAADEDLSAVPGGGSCHSAGGSAPLPLLPVTLSQGKDSTGNVVLYWNAVPGATAYRVYAGTQPGMFDLPIVTVTGTELMPKGLVKGKVYYFAVRAIGGSGQEALRFSNVAVLKVGPEWLLGASGVMGLLGAAYVRRKKRARDEGFESVTLK